MKKYLSLLFCLLLSCLYCVSCADQEEKAASALAKRIIPEYASQIRFVHLSNDDIAGPESPEIDTTVAGEDFFTLESKGGRIVIGGNNANSMAVGLNYYLNNYCLTTVSWEADAPIEIPSSVLTGRACNSAGSCKKCCLGKTGRLPAIAEKVTVPAIVEDRFLMNYCTYGYTMPWWTWTEWERFIDWMALNGVTMPLNITGQEAVWEKVWESFGMSEEQVRAFFTGPAVLPWHRMMNMDRWLGPLPQSWIDGQAELQKKILARERELAMTPVLSAFSGHIPSEMAAIYPDAIIHPVSLWDGFEENFRCSILHPDDTLFAEIQKRFLQEQEKMYGTDHVYCLDVFNEVDFFEGREWDPEELARISSKIYGTLQAADPDALWLQMGWMMYYDSKHWTPANIQAYLESVPQGKMIMLDYFCEKSMIWEYTDRFFGQPYYFCFLGNFGGNTNLSGDFHEISTRIDKTLAEGREGLMGLGCTLEGFGVSQFLYEYTLSRAWNTGIDDEQWVKTLADRRAGCENPAIEQAYRLLTDDIYTVCTTSGICPEPSLHPSLEGDWRWTTVSAVPYTYEQIAEVWKLLLSSPASTDAYRFDIVNIGSEVLKLAFRPIRDRITEAYLAKDIEALKAAVSDMNHFYDQWESLLACHRDFSLKNWIDDARRWGTTDEEKDYYERGARVVVTTWGGTGILTDYANRQWSGLVSGYYRARWELFCNALVAELEGTGPAFDQTTFDQQCRELELSFGYPDYKINWTTPADALEVAQSIAAELGII